MPHASAAVEIPAAAVTEDVRFATGDGHILAGRLHLPAGSPSQAVVLHGGVGFPARFYQDFAAWLSQELAAAVLTYDYRDFGWSQARPLLRSDACLSQWSIGDQGAALAWTQQRFSGLPVRVLGHSLGGQWLAFHQGIERVDRVVTVGSGPGWWLDHPWSMIPLVTLFWWLAGPLATAARGYTPGKALGLGADIPAGVYWEWRRLCLGRDFHRARWGKDYPQPPLNSARFRLTLVPIADDTLIAPHMVRKLRSYYPHADVRERLLDPAELGLGRIGHGGAFLARNRACWPLLAAGLADAP